MLPAIITPEVTRRIEEIQSLIDDYQESLSYYITVSANPDQINKNKIDAAIIGNKLLGKTEDMSLLANESSKP